MRFCLEMCELQRDHNTRSEQIFTVHIVGICPSPISNDPAIFRRGWCVCVTNGNGQIEQQLQMYLFRTMCISSHHHDDQEGMCCTPQQRQEQYVSDKD